MLTRLKVFRQWLRDSHGVGPAGMLRHLAAPPYTLRARTYMAAITPAGNFFEVRVRDVGLSLYYPASLPLRSLCIVVAEQMDPTSWHRYDTGETTLVSDDVVVDCGASEGLFSAIARKCRRVVAVEPLPLFGDALEKTFAEVGNVSVIHAALSDKCEEARLSSDSIYSRIGEAGDIAVRTTTVDEVCPDATYIKADIEGHELQMLHGARETIARNKPRLALATYHRRGDAEKFKAYLSSLNPNYRFREVGICPTGEPVLLRAW